MKKNLGDILDFKYLVIKKKNFYISFNKVIFKIVALLELNLEGCLNMQILPNTIENLISLKKTQFKKL